MSRVCDFHDSKEPLFSEPLLQLVGLIAVGCLQNVLPYFAVDMVEQIILTGILLKRLSFKIISDIWFR